MASNLGTHQVFGILDQLSEESAFQLLQLVERRSRRAALRVQAGQEPGDLQALRTLQTALEEAHRDKLLLR